MKLRVTYSLPKKAKADAGVFLFYKDDKSMAGKVNKFGISSGVLRRHGFSGKRDEAFEFYPVTSQRIGGFTVLGLGDKHEFELDNVRRAGGIFAGIIAKRKIKSVALLSIPDYKENIGPFIEGMILGGYTFDRFKSEKTDDIVLKLIINEDAGKYRKEIKKAVVLAESASFARDLINTPGNYLTPVIFANRARALARKFGIRTRIYGPQDITAMKMDALMGVAKGSTQPPRLITWIYNGGKRNDKPVVFVGKGVTFDSGGISIKPSEGMGEMKNDMAGAAVVVSLMMVLGKLKPRLNAVGIVPAVENMPSGKALKPGDIVTVSDGQTIEIISTDAEGRLILADGLCFAHKFKPKKIIDIATLTGAARVALGETTAAIIGNNDAMLKSIYEAGQRTSEKTWQLPLWNEYQELIKSEVADMKNSGGRPAGTITASCLLSRFVKNVPWVHIDIASVDNQNKSHPYQPKGATGFGTRLLAEYLLSQ